MSDQDQFLTVLRDWMETSMHRSIHGFIRQNRESALSLSQVSALYHLYHQGSGPIHRLVNHLGISMPAVSQLLESLVESGHIIRSTDPTDRRVKLIQLTEKGTETVEKSMQARHAWLTDLAAALTPEEKEQLLPGLEILSSLTRSQAGLDEPRCKKKASPTP